MTGSTVFATSVQAVLARADIVKVSGDDLEFMFPGMDKMTAARALREQTHGVVLFTDGTNAVHVMDAAAESVVEVPRIPVVDTVGAGDSFSGGFLASWMRQGLGRRDLADHAKVVEATEFGVAVAGITCQRPGADPPYANEVVWS